MRANPKKLNPLQLKTLTILQALARERERAFTDAPAADGAVAIHSLPHAHGDHVHIGPAVVAARDATGVGNHSVLNALARKGLLRRGPAGLPLLTAEGLGYETGIAAAILHGADH